MLSSRLARSRQQPSPHSSSNLDSNNFLFPSFQLNLPDHIHAATIADLPNLDTECILERARIVSQAPSRMPYIGIYGRYNKRWYVDVIALPHNAIRCLVSKIFELISSAHRLALDMTIEDFDNLFAFLKQFHQFVTLILQAEDKILYPDMEAALKKRPDYHSHALHPSARNTTKSKMYSLLRNITDQKLKYTPSVTVIHILQHTIDKLSSQLLEYFSIKESILPRIIFNSIRGSKEKTRMEARLIKYFEERTKQEYFYTALLTIPLNNEQVRAEFEERHFYKSKRQFYRQAVQQVQNSLLAIPTIFENAAKKYEHTFSMKTFVETYGTDRNLYETTQLVEKRPST